MRLSNLLWIVALITGLRSGHTRQHPKMYGKRDATRLRRNYEFIDSNAGNQFKHQFKSQYNSKNWESAEDETLQDGISCDTVPQPSQETTCAPVGAPNPTTCQTQSPPTQSPQNAGCNILQQQQQHQYAPQQQYPPPPSQQQQQYPEQQQQQQQQQQPYEPDDSELRGKELRKLVQHLYVAQARVQLEATEIHKAQAVASSAQSQLEDSANHVRTITATLHNAQQEVAAAAIRAQIAQLQLAAHDQLLFAARQDVDALSSQVVGLQAAEGIVQPKLTVDLHALLDKLRQPLQHFDRPTPVPMIITLPPFNAAPQGPSTGLDMGTSVTKTGIREDADHKELVRMKASHIHK